jgi:hypothetical protein
LPPAPDVLLVLPVLPVSVGAPWLLVVGQMGIPRIPGGQVLDVCPPLGFDELLVAVGVSLAEVCDVVSPAECDGLEDDRLRLCVEEWWELGVLDDAVLLAASLVPTGVVGTAVGDGELEVDSVGAPLGPWEGLPDPPNTTAAAPATSRTAVATAPTTVFRLGPPGMPGPTSSASPPSSSSPSPSAAAAAAGAGASSDTWSKVRVASRSTVFSDSGLSTCVCCASPPAGVVTPGRNQSSGALVCTGGFGSSGSASVFGRGMLGRLRA